MCGDRPRSLRDGRTQDVKPDFFDRITGAHHFDFCFGSFCLDVADLCQTQSGFVPVSGALLAECVYFCPF